MTTYSAQTDVWQSYPGRGHALLASLGSGAVAVDYFRTASGAQYAADILNRGAAHIEPHRPIGCRVMPGTPSLAAAPMETSSC